MQGVYVEYHQDLGKLVIPKCVTLNELLDEYVNLYGKAKWSMAFYSANTGLIEHYISPIIGDLKLNEINTRVLEKFYQRLQQTPAVKRIGTDIHRHRLCKEQRDR